jgi:hypothetical protein
MLIRRFTLEESVRLCVLSVRIGREVDEELGRLVGLLAGGDDGVLPAIHDRLNVCGRCETADLLRRIITEPPPPRRRRGGRR